MRSIQEQVNEQIASLYVAFFDRAPDEAGLNYWYNVATEDGALTNPDYIYDIAAGFAQHPAFENIYSDMTDEAFVEAIYMNVTNNDNIDSDALIYWTEQIAEYGRADMVANFTTTVLEYNGDDADGQYRTAYLQAKVDTGLSFAGTLGEESNPTSESNLDNDPAYIASQFIMSKFNEASTIAEVNEIEAEALAYIGNHPTLDMWVNQNPEINPTDAVVLDEDGQADGSVMASDIDNKFVGQDLLFSLNAAPAHGEVEVNSDGTFTYTPYQDYNGTDSFVVQVEDGEGGVDTAVVNITVNPVNDAPVAPNASVITDEDTAIKVTVEATDADGDALTYSIAAQASHGNVFINPDGSFTYTPDENFHGTDTFTYVANDATVDSNEATVTVDVNAVNDAPVTSDLSVVTDEDTAGAGQVIATDVDGDTLTYSISNAPVNGDVVLDSATGEFSYTPYQDYNGEDTFEVMVDDGNGGTAVSKVNLTVTPVNDAPVAENASVITDEDNAIDIVATATDVDGDPLTYRVVVAAEHGTVVVNPNGTFTYAPEENYNGTDSFKYVANDGTVDSNEATVSINVDAVAPEFTLTSLEASVLEGSSMLFTLNASEPVDQDTEVTFTLQPGRVDAPDAGTNFTNDNDFAEPAKTVTVTIPAGETQAWFTVEGLVDDITEENEIYTVKAEIVSGDGAGADPLYATVDLINVQSGCTFELTSSPDVQTAVVFNSTPAYTPGGNDLVNTLQDEDILTGNLDGLGGDCATDTELNVTLGSSNDGSEVMVAPTLVDVHNVNVMISHNAAGINFQKTDDVRAVNIDAITTLDADVDMINMQESTTALSVSNATTNGEVLFNYQEGQLEGTDDSVTLGLDGVRLDYLGIDQGDASKHDNTEDEDYGIEHLTVNVENRSTNIDKLMIEANAMEDRYADADQDITFNVNANLEVNQLIAQGAEEITINTASGTRTEVTLDENKNDESNVNRGLDLAEAMVPASGSFWNPPIIDYAKAIQTDELEHLKITGDGVVILNGVTGATDADYSKPVDTDLFIDASTMTNTLGIRVDDNVAADWGSRLESGTGNDEVITTDDTWMSIDTSDGDDVIRIHSDYDHDHAERGYDDFDGSNTNATVKTGEGSDLVIVDGDINAAMDTSSSDTSANIDTAEDGDTVNANDLNANLTTGAGADHVNLNGSVSHSTLNMGSENDTLTVSGNLSSDSTVETEEGDDTVSFGGSTYGKIITANGNDAVTISGNASGVEGDLNTRENSGLIDLGTGMDTLTVYGDLETAVVAGSDAETGNDDGQDTVTVHGELSGNASITTQAGDDVVSTGNLGVSNVDEVTTNKTTEVWPGTNTVKSIKVEGSPDYDTTFAASISTGTGNDTVTVGDLASGGQYNDNVIDEDTNLDDTINIIGATVDTGAGDDTLYMGTVAENAEVHTGSGVDDVTVKMTDDAVMLAADGVYTIPKGNPAGTPVDSEVSAGSGSMDYRGATVNLGSEDDTILFTDVDQTPNTDDTTLIVGQGALLDGDEGYDVLTVETVDSVDVVDSKSIQDGTGAVVEGFVRGIETVNLTFQDAISDNRTASTLDGLEGISAEVANDDYTETQVGDGSGDASGTIRMDVAHVDTDLATVNLTSNEKRIKLDDTIIPEIISEAEDEDGRPADSIDNGWVQGDTTRFDLENFRDEIEINLAAYEVTGLSVEEAEGASVKPNPITDPTAPGFAPTKVAGQTTINTAALALELDNELANKGPRESLQDDCETDVTVTVNMDENPDLDDDPIDTSFTINLNANDNIVDPTDANYDVEIISIDTETNANANDPSYYANNITINVADQASHAIELQDTFGEDSNGNVTDKYYRYLDVFDNAYTEERDDTQTNSGFLLGDVRTSLTVNTDTAGEEILLMNVDADTITATGASDIFLQVRTENNYTITTGEGNDIINMKNDTLRYEAAPVGPIDENDYIDGGAGVDTLVIAGGQNIDLDVMTHNIRNIENIEVNFDEYTEDDGVESSLVIDSSHLDRINITNTNEDEDGIADMFIAGVNTDEEKGLHIVNLDIFASLPAVNPHDSLIIDANIDTTCDMPESCNLPRESNIHSADLILNIDSVDTDLDIRVNTAEGSTVNLGAVDQDEQVEITATVSSIMDTYVDGLNGGNKEGDLMITSDTAALDKLILIDEKTYTDCELDGGEVTSPNGPTVIVTVADEWADAALEIDASDIGNPDSGHVFWEIPTTTELNVIDAWHETDAELLIKGTNDGDLIHGGQKDDVIYGDRGNDIIIAGEGYDVVDGGSGDDRIYGGLNGDTLTGESIDWIDGVSGDALETVGWIDPRPAENTFVLGVKEVRDGDGTAQNAIDESNSGLDGRNADTITDFETGLDTLEINLGEVFNSDADNVVDLGTYAIVDNPADGDDSLSGSATDPIVGDSYYSEEDGKHKFVMDVDGSGDITTNDITVMSEGIINAADLDIQMRTGAGDDTIRLGQSVDRIDAGADDDTFVLVGAIDEADQATYLADLHDNNVMNSIEDLGLGNVVDPNELITLRDQTEATAGDELVGGAGNDVLYVYGSADLTVMNISADIETLYVNSDVTLTEAQLNNFTTIEFGGSTEHAITVKGGDGNGFSRFDGYIVTNNNYIPEGTVIPIVSVVTVKNTSTGDVVLTGTGGMAAYVSGADVVDESANLPAIGIDTIDDFNAEDFEDADGTIVSGIAVGNSEVTLTVSNGRDEDLVVKVQVPDNTTAVHDVAWSYNLEDLGQEFKDFVTDFDGTVTVTAETMEGDDKVSTDTIFEVDTILPVMDDVVGSVEENAHINATPNTLTDQTIDTNLTGDLVFSEANVTVTGVEFEGSGVEADLEVDGDYGTLKIAGDAASGYTFTYTKDVAAIDALTTGDTPEDIFTITYEDDLGNVNTVTSTVTMDMIGADDIAEITGDLTGDVKEAEDTSPAPAPAPDTCSGTVTVEDPDAGEQNFTTLSGPLYGTFTFINNGNGDANWTYELIEAKEEVQALSEGETLRDTVTVTTVDGTTEDIVITITGTNDKPVVTKAIDANETGFTVTVADVDIHDTLTFVDGINGAVVKNDTPDLAEGETVVTAEAQTTAKVTNVEITDGHTTNVEGILAAFGEGTNGNDTFNDSTYDRILFGFDGDDLMKTSDGNDFLVGGDGADRMHGGEGDDILIIDDDDTVMRGGNNTTSADPENDTARLAADVDVRNDTFDRIEHIVMTEDGADLSLTVAQMDPANDGDIETVTGVAGGVTELLKVYKDADGDANINTANPVTFTDAALYYDTTDKTGDDTVTGSQNNDEFHVHDDLKNTDTIDGGAGVDSLYIGDDNAQTDLDGIKNIEKIEINNTGSSTDYKLSANTLIATGATLAVTHTAGAANELKLDISANTTDGILHFEGNDNKDTVTGGSGNDYMTGKGGIDTLDGGLGNDELLGGDDGDTLKGGAGEDTLDGESGADTLEGGADNDTINLADSDSAADTVKYNSGTDGSDTINGFETGEDQYDTDFSTTASNFTFSSVEFTQAGELVFTTSSTEGVQVVAADTSGVDMSASQDVIDMLSGTGLVKTQAANDTFLLDIASADEANHYVYEANDADGDQYIQNNELQLVGTFVDAGFGDGDIV